MEVLWSVIFYSKSTISRLRLMEIFKWKYPMGHDVTRFVEMEIFVDVTIFFAKSATS